MEFLKEISFSNIALDCFYVRLDSLVLDALNVIRGISKDGNSQAHMGCRKR